MKSLLQAAPKKNNLPYLTPNTPDFETHYLDIRTREGRLHPDTLVQQIPHLPPEHPHHKEWKLRAWNTQRILQYLKKEKPLKILDLGCGNGWFTHKLAEYTGAEVLGVDINAYELEQAVRLFQSTYCHFAYADIFQANLPQQYFDAIILNSCVQYFEDIQSLLYHLRKLLISTGSIHILDSPFYHAEALEAARTRTAEYYRDQGVEEMDHHYFHHTWESLQAFRPEVLYQPDRWWAKVRRRLVQQGTPFPWIRISASI